LRTWLLLAALAAALAAAPPARASGVAPTPPMGWSNWDRFGCSVNEQVVLQSADAIARTGMRRAGYRYVNVDDCWMARERDASGALVADPARFPHGMAWLARAVHARGLRFGLYLSAGEATCAGYPGSFDRFDDDVHELAAWGVDYLKVDWCWPPPGFYPDAAYAQVHAAVAAAGRPMVVSVSTDGWYQPWLWAPAAANLWRIAPDLPNDWAAVMETLDAEAPLWPYAHPGAWNDPDMLQIGNGRLNETEQRSYFSLWCMLAAPLIAGSDVRRMTSPTRRILTNAGAIAVDQDRLGRQGRRIRAEHGHEIWLRRLAGGRWALLFLNRTRAAAVMHADLRRLPPLPRAFRYLLSDLWAHRTSRTAGELRVAVAAHGVAMFRLKPVHRARKHSRRRRHVPK
jgi:alpha-galactosidase